jgi:hypothetical protein
MANMQLSSWYKRISCMWLASTILLYALTSIAWAHPQEQTVPTMPPLTFTPTSTLTRTSQIHPTNTPQPPGTQITVTVTQIQPPVTPAPGTMPTDATQTASFPATETIAVMTAVVTPSEYKTSTFQAGSVPAASSTFSSASTTLNTAITGQPTTDKNSNGMGLFGLILGGILFFVLIWAAFWLWYKKRSVHN